ncbi:MAG TPA: GAF domain-containing protein [Longimicrobiales bacterium]|nr:GAF domain-containing protein [Longimicrobiales bacterium]
MTGHVGPGSLRSMHRAVVDMLAAAAAVATNPLEVYRLALSRVAPLIEADFGSVFLRDPEDLTLLKLVCAHNWPQSSARHLGNLRIRIGRGPTGQAVADGVSIEVADVFKESEMREWWQPARELGFTSLIATPLIRDDLPHGAISFYYTSPRQPDPDRRALVEATARAVAPLLTHSD